METKEPQLKLEVLLKFSHSLSGDVLTSRFRICNFQNRFDVGWLSNIIATPAILIDPL